MKILKICSVMLFSLLASCAGLGTITLMEQVQRNDYRFEAEKGKASIVFYRPVDGLHADKAIILNASNAKPSLYGYLVSGTAMQIQVLPGEYKIFSTATAGRSEMMHASVTEGKTYYVKVDAWTNGFGAIKFFLKPVKEESAEASELKSILKEIRFVEKNSKSDAWLQSHIKSINNKLSGQMTQVHLDSTHAW